jgi:hypothetical protein
MPQQPRRVSELRKTASTEVHGHRERAGTSSANELPATARGGQDGFMKMWVSFRSIATGLVLVLSPGALHAELPDIIKRMADQFDTAMKSYDTSIELQQKLARDAYLRRLEIERQRSAATKRPADLKAIDAELASLKAGALPTQAPEGFPQTLDTHRTAFLAATDRATTTIDRARSDARTAYLGWLNKLEATVKGRDKATEDAVASERKRITPAENSGAK